MSVTTLYERLVAFPHAQLRIFGRDETTTKTFADLNGDVVRLMSELRECGIGSRDVVGLLGENSYEWVVADLALLGLDCVSVALPPEIQRESSLSEIVEKYELVALLLTRRPLHGTTPISVANLEDRPVRLSKRRPRTARLNAPSGVFTIAFSSGTSGRRKGLLMTKDGVEQTILVSGVSWNVTRHDNILIVMPFAIFQQRYLLYLAIWFGSTVSIVPPVHLFRRLRDASPTIAVGPPSFFEVLENRIAAERGWRKIPLFIAIALHALLPESRGWRVRRALCRRWTGMYGTRPRLFFVGSAPTRGEMVRLFQRIGLPLFEAYGMTEFGWIAFNLPQRNRVGSPGQPVKGVEIARTGEGELLVRSPSPQAIGYVFEGVDENDAVFLPHLTVATGDLGRVDPAGFLRLTGRRKNVIVTRSGVKINPEEIEAEIENGCLITRAMVMDDPDGAMLRCVVWMDEWQQEPQKHAIKTFVGGMNKRRDPAHFIGDVLFRPSQELSVETGTLTSNHKVNRTAVLAGLRAGEKGQSWARK